MDVSVAGADDVSSLDSDLAVGPKEWLSSTRPVVGAIAASSLMLLACSWFALNSDALGPRHDVGAPDPVRIEGVAPQRVGTPATPAAPSGRRAPADVSARRTARGGAAAATPEIRRSSEPGPASVPRAGTGPLPSSSKLPSTSSAAATSAPAAPTLPPVVPDVTSTLPAPPEVPSVTLPPITAPVTVPSLSVPAVSTVVTIVGVP